MVTEKQKAHSKEDTVQGTSMGNSIQLASVKDKFPVAISVLCGITKKNQYVLRSLKKDKIDICCQEKRERIKISS